MSIKDLPNLASAQLGTSIIYATDEWFAAADNMISDAEPVWDEAAFTPFGKWMDGWESRRRRTEGHDWCVLQLGLPGVIKAIEVDTRYFTGNYSPKVSIYGTKMPEANPVMDQLCKLRNDSAKARPEYGRMGLCASDEENRLVAELNSERWQVLVPLSALGAGYEETSKTTFHIAACAGRGGDGVVSHLRVNMGPDGGITRVRVYGEVVVNPAALVLGQDVDLAAVQLGGQAVACSNKHYGHPRNLILPGRGNCMGDGWETARQPKRPAVYEKGQDGLMVLPGYDWALLKLGAPGIVSLLDVDTHFFKGNYPESCSVEACLLPKEVQSDQLQSEEGIQAQGQQQGGWQVLLPRVRLGPDAQHSFAAMDGKLRNVGPVSHLKITIFPDGGIMRVRAFGRPAADPSSRL